MAAVPGARLGGIASPLQNSHNIRKGLVLVGREVMVRETFIESCQLISHRADVSSADAGNVK